jgi:alpha 1,3-glucosidase
MEYPSLEELYQVDDQFLVGSDLLVKPVTHPGVTETDVLFPTSDLWYDVDTMEKVRMEQEVRNIASITVSSDIDKIPVYQRGGSIIPRKLRLRRSTQMMVNDPYTIYIALDKNKHGSGIIYMDDEDSFDHKRKGYFAIANISADISNYIRSEVKGNKEWIRSQPTSNRMIERIVVMGIEKSPKRVGNGSFNLQFDYNDEAGILVIRKPGLSALEDWEISFEN